jgi:poly-gamma-glutamate capsule biosynthesis protein CapA/YwtB (metallophosphatase superfamily)
MKKKLIAIVLVFVVLAAASFWVYKRQIKTNQGTSQPKTSTSQSKAVENPTKIRFIATGDAIAHDALNQAAQTGDTWDYLPIMKDLKPIFEAADIRFCNQAVLGGGKQFGITGYPVFNSPTEFGRDLNREGCNLVNTASNHSNDKTQAVINSTVSSWDNLPNMLTVAGANRSVEEQQKIHYFTVKGIKFAFLSYVGYTNKAPVSSYGITMFNESVAATQLAEAKKNADMVIVSMRWGTEYSQSINAQQTAQSQFLADHGASIVLGHGPHVLEPVKTLTGSSGNKTLVWYSLGNFINAQEEPETVFSGFAVMDIDTKTKTISDVTYLPLYMHYEWTPSQKARDDLLSRNNFRMVLLENATQAMINAQQLTTTADQQRSRLNDVLSTYMKVPLITSSQYYNQ